MLNKRTLKDGVVQYLVKWTDLGYAESTWEDEDEEIPELPIYIQYYEAGLEKTRVKQKTSPVFFFWFFGGFWVFFYIFVQKIRVFRVFSV